MAGTHEGGLKASAYNKARYGENFYKEIVRTAGAIGGRKSRKGPKYTVTGGNDPTVDGGFKLEPEVKKHWWGK